MIRDMRRFKQQLSEEDTIDIFKNNSYGVLAVPGDDDYPYAVPLSYAYSNGKIYVHSAAQGHKVDAVKNGVKASFCVVEKDEVRPEKMTTLFRSAIAFGTAKIVIDENEKLEALQLIAHKYFAVNGEGNNEEIKNSWNRVCVIALEIEHMTGKASMDLINKK